jgi:thiol-disulfide isomerase/thioredoxin
MDTEEKIKFGFNLNFWFLIIPLIAILTVFLFNFSIVKAIDSFLAKSIAEKEEAARPANVEITLVRDSSCGDCYDLMPALEAIKKENVKIISEKNLEISDSEALEIINKFKVTRVPFFVMSGELEKEDSLKTLLGQMGETKENTFVFTKTGAPYVLATSGDVRGRVKITMISDQGCADCYDVTGHDPILQSFGLNTSNQVILDSKQPEGQELIKQYKIKLLPAFILEGDLSEFPQLFAIWSSVGTAEKNNVYIFREGVKQMGTYKDLSTGKIITPEPQSE